MAFGGSPHASQSVWSDSVSSRFNCRLGFYHRLKFHNAFHAAFILLAFERFSIVVSIG